MTDKPFVATLEDNILHQCSAWTNSLATRLKQELADVRSNLHEVIISVHGRVNHIIIPAERRIQTAKRLTNTILDRTGAPACTWLLCLLYI